MKLQVMHVMDSPPGPRYRDQGKGSGQEFMEDHLIPAFDKAFKNKETLIVDMDGSKYGYPTSFLEEAFGGLARERGTNVVKQVIEIKCTSEPMLAKEIMHYIEFGQQDRTPPYEPRGDEV